MTKIIRAIAVMTMYGTTMIIILCSPKQDTTVLPIGFCFKGRVLSLSPYPNLEDQGLGPGCALSGLYPSTNLARFDLLVTGVPADTALKARLHRRFLSR